MLDKPNQIKTWCEMKLDTMMFFYFPYLRKGSLFQYILEAIKVEKFVRLQHSFEVALKIKVVSCILCIYFTTKNKDFIQVLRTTMKLHSEISSKADLQQLLF